MKKIKKVVIPVAGLGTRGLPFTKEVPKELVPVLDTPAIHFIVEEALDAGIEQIVFITGKGKVALEDYFDLSPMLEMVLRKKGKEELADKVRYIGSCVGVVSIRQKEPLGLGHAVGCARSVIGDERFAVCVGDEIFPPWGGSKPGLVELVEAAERVSGSVIGVMEVPEADTCHYGIIDTKGASVGVDPVPVYRTVEKPKSNAPSRYAVIGRYVFEPQLFDHLEKTKPGVGGEIQLTDGMDGLSADGTLSAVTLTGKRYDLGNPYTLLKAQIDAALLRPELADRVKAYIKTLC